MYIIFYKIILLVHKKMPNKRKRGRWWLIFSTKVGIIHKRGFFGENYRMAVVYLSLSLKPLHQSALNWSHNCTAVAALKFSTLSGSDLSNLIIYMSSSNWGRQGGSTHREERYTKTVWGVQRGFEVPHCGQCYKPFFRGNLEFLQNRKIEISLFLCLNLRKNQNNAILETKIYSKCTPQVVFSFKSTILIVSAKCK